MVAVSPSPSELRDQIDRWLEGFLADRSQAVPDAGDLIAEIARVVRLGGKRLRPTFCYWGYRATGHSHDDRIVAAAASLELLHTFALVHDDIMDSALVRRGEKTTVAAHGSDIALLTGDLALVLADEGFMTSGFDAETLARGFGVYSRMRHEVIAGQYLELVTSTKEAPSEEEARRVAALKSGFYSVAEPVTIGAVLGGASETIVDSVRAYGLPLGEAFQLRDDLLGTFGDPDVVGKPVDSDIREGKRHLLFVKALARASDDDRAVLLRDWGRADLSPDEVEHLRSILVGSGAVTDIEALIQRLASAAREALDSVEIDTQARAALGSLIDSVVSRES
ncbi:MAG TPA: polyprenyl synthetase family protein [Actinomycetota bacterium]|nr:polyprenyl synthetase family protein [Actinomycetota bacterium]